MLDSMDQATIQCMIKGDFHSISQYCCVCSMMCVTDNKKGFVQTLLTEPYTGEELGHLQPTELEGWPWASQLTFLSLSFFVSNWDEKDIYRRAKVMLEHDKAYTIHSTESEHTKTSQLLLYVLKVKKWQ